MATGWPSLRAFGPWRQGAARRMEMKSRWAERDQCEKCRVISVYSEGEPSVSEEKRRGTLGRTAPRQKAERVEPGAMNSDEVSRAEAASEDHRASSGQRAHSQSVPFGWLATLEVSRHNVTNIVYKGIVQRRIERVFW